MAVNPTKKQHYVPQSYLNKFLSESEAKKSRFFGHVYDFKKSIFFKESGENVFAEKYFYIPKDTSEINYIDLENYFKDNIDPIPVSSSFDGLINGGHIPNKDQLELLFFISFQYYRTPDFIKTWSKIQRNQYIHSLKIWFRNYDPVQVLTFALLWDDQNRDFRNNPMRLYNMALNMLDSDEVWFKHHKKDIFNQMFTRAVELVNLLNQHNWLVVHLHESAELIASDNPLVIIPPEGFDSNIIYGVPMDHQTVKFFPLDSNTLLVFLGSHMRIKHITIDSEKSMRLSDIVNKLLAINAHLNVMGRSENSIKSSVENVTKNNSELFISKEIIDFFMVSHRPRTIYYQEVCSKFTDSLNELINLPSASPPTL
jgi:hypothetical protein